MTARQGRSRSSGRFTIPGGKPPQDDPDQDVPPPGPVNDPNPRSAAPHVSVRRATAKKATKNIKSAAYRSSVAASRKSGSAKSAQKQAPARKPPAKRPTVQQSSSPASASVDSDLLAPVLAALAAVEASLRDVERRFRDAESSLELILESLVDALAARERVDASGAHRDLRAVAEYARGPLSEILITGSSDRDRLVVPNPTRGGWDVVKVGGKRASAHASTKREAVSRAREIVENQGGGEVRQADRYGRFSDSETTMQGDGSSARDTK